MTHDPAPPTARYPASEANPVQSPPELWQQTLGQLKAQTTRATYDTYLHGCRLLRADGGGWEVSCRHELAADWLNNRLGPMINRVAGQIAGAPVSVRFVPMGTLASPGSRAPVRDAAPVRVCPVGAASAVGAGPRAPAPAPHPEPASAGWAGADWSDYYIKLKLAFRCRALALLKGAPLSIFLCLAFHLDRQGVAKPGIMAIMSETGYSRPAVCSGLGELERLGLIRKVATSRANGLGDAYQVLGYAWFGHDPAPSLWEEETGE